MTSLKSIGNLHVLNVYSALIKFLNQESSIDEYSDGIKQNVNYLIKKYPNIADVKVKFDFSNPDEHPDLTITLGNGEIIKVNLFSIEGKGRVQPKNLGVKSFLMKYFQSENLQMKFNEIVNQYYEQFLKSVIGTYGKVNVYANITELKKRVRVLYPKFSDEINPIRRSFLFSLREQLFDLLQHAQTTMTEGFLIGFKELMLSDSINIVTRYNKKNKCSILEEVKFSFPINGNIQLYKKGNDTVGLRIGETALTLRLKFESSPVSSLKIATSYDLFPLDNERIKINQESLDKLKELMEKKIYTPKSSDSNAVGKCNEALIYATFVGKYPTIYQIDNQECINMYKNYAPRVKKEVINHLLEASKITADKIEIYLKEKYDHYEIESIQLVPQNYIKNRLDTADLLITIIAKGEKIDSYFSLKAIAKSGSQITVKNPGIGTILGEEYFGIGSMVDVVERVKEKFEQEILNHQQSMEEVSFELGQRLSKAEQSNLKKGLAALFGAAPTVVTFYEVKKCIIKEHSQILSTVEVLIKTPTAINTTLIWNNGQDQIKLRVKFSASQSKGWSSLKLAGEYEFK